MFRAIVGFVKENLQLVWTRLTLSKITIAYVVFTVMHCVIQVTLQGEAFMQNNRADYFLKDIFRAAKLPVPRGVRILVKNGPLYVCQDSPNTNYCSVIWAPKPSNLSSVAGGSSSVFSGTVNPSATSTYTYPTGTGVYGDGAAIVIGSTSIPASTSSSSVSGLNGTPVALSPSSISPSGLDVVKTTQAAPVPALGEFVDEDDRAKVPSSATSSGLVLPTIQIDVTLANAYEQTSPSLPLLTSEDFVSHEWRRRSLHTRVGRGLKVGAARFDSNGTLISVPISGVPTTSAASPSRSQAASSSGSTTTPGVVDLSPTCVDVLTWPLQNLAASGREDVVFLVFNIWVFGMSLVAVLNESMPHMIAAVVTHIMMTAWAAVQVVTTENFRTEFLRITKDGACRGVNLLPTYWEQRRNIELAELILNVVALFVSIFLSWRLIKQFGWQTFKRVGASLSVNHMYKLVLGLSVVLQLSLFFIISSMVLWIEQLCNGPARFVTKHLFIYEILYLITIILLVPWVACGWFGVRAENKEVTLTFLVGAVWVIMSWGGMFFSHVFRLLFASWGFFAMMTVVAMILSGITLVLGIACRLNFGKNSKVLARYLHQDEESINEKRDISEEFTYGEKFEFPASEVPTYNSVVNRVPVPPLTIPVDAHTNPNSRDHSPFSSRSGSPTPNEDQTTHSRTNSHASSMRSDYSGGSAEARRGSPVKAWVIE